MARAIRRCVIADHSLCRLSAGRHIARSSSLFRKTLPQYARECVVSKILGDSSVHAVIGAKPLTAAAEIRSSDFMIIPSNNADPPADFPRHRSSGQANPSANHAVCLHVCAWHGSRILPQCSWTSAVDLRRRACAGMRSCHVTVMISS